MQESNDVYRDSLLEIFNSFKSRLAGRGGEFVVNLKDIESYFVKMKSTGSGMQVKTGTSGVPSSKIRSEECRNRGKS